MGELKKHREAYVEAMDQLVGLINSLKAQHYFKITERRTFDRMQDVLDGSIYMCRESKSIYKEEQVAAIEGLKHFMENYCQEYIFEGANNQVNEVSFWGSCMKVLADFGFSVEDHTWHFSLDRANHVIPKVEDPATKEEMLVGVAKIFLLHMRSLNPNYYHAEMEDVMWDGSSEGDKLPRGFGVISGDALNYIGLGIFSSPDAESMSLPPYTFRIVIKDTSISAIEYNMRFNTIYLFKGSSRDFMEGVKFAEQLREVSD